MDERQDRPRMWLTRRALFLHLTVVIVVPLFLGLFWWQVQRVRQGNTLSWAYVFEWPFFTGYAVYLWWRLVHEQPEVEARPAAPSARATHAGRVTEVTVPTEATEATEEDEELAAYNRYLAELDATGRPKRW